MKKVFCVLAIASVACLSQAQLLTTDQSTVIAAGGQFVDLPGASGSLHTTLDLPDGNKITFSNFVVRLNVPEDWSVWRPGSQPKLLESRFGTPVTLTFDQPVSTFGLEMMPVWLAGRNMRMDILEGGSGQLTQFVSADTGALFFGFTEGSVTKLRLSRLPLTDTGSFAFGNILYNPVPEPATWITIGIGTLVFAKRRSGRSSRH